MSLESSAAGARNNPKSGPGPAGFPDTRAVTRRRVAGAVGVVVAAWGILTALLILGGEGIKHSSTVTTMDQKVTAFVVSHRTPALDQLMKVVTWAGSWVALFGVAVRCVPSSYWRRILPILAVIAVLVAWWGELLAVTLTKAVVQRPRPPEALRLVAASRVGLSLRSHRQRHRCVRRRRRPADHPHHRAEVEGPGVGAGRAGHCSGRFLKDRAGRSLDDRRGSEPSSGLPAGS